MGEEHPGPRFGLTLEEALGLGRLHIVAIAALAAAVFGFLFTGRVGLLAGALVALDWFLLNLWNRVADVPEDLQNGVAGTGFVALHARALSRGAWAVWGLSLVAFLPWGAGLLALRLAFQLGGYAYSFRLLGLRRIKEVFLVKNVFSGLLFIESVLGYGLALTGARPPLGEALFLIAFFLPLEVTYELIYDLRDVEGDRSQGIVTLPVAWGAARTRRFLWALLALSAGALVLGSLAGALRWRETVMLAAPIQHALVLRFWIPGGVRKQAAIRLTWLGAAQLFSYLCWIGLGLPLEPLW